MRSLAAAWLVGIVMLPSAGASAQTELCRGAREFLAEELAMATVVEPDTIDDMRTGERLPMCRVTAAGLTTRSPAGTARHVFQRLREAGWVRSPDPLDSPNEASLRFRSGGADCLFTYVSGGLLDTEAALRADGLIEPGAGERRYNVLARCVPVLPAAPGPSGGGAAAQEPPRLRSGDLVLEGGRLFDATGAEARPNPGILVRDGVITALGVSAEGGAAPGVRVLRLPPDRTVLPGFIDLHAHYAIDLFGTGRVDEHDVNPVIFLANGVTSTFPAGEVDPEGMRRTRLAIDAGERPGPRIHNSGPYFGTARPGWEGDAMTPDSIAAEVGHWVSLGVRGFKAKGIRAGQLQALIDAAHAYGLTVTGHLGSGFRGTVNPAQAIEMGIDRVEHFIGGRVLPPERPAYTSLEGLNPNRQAHAQMLLWGIVRYLENGVFYDATLTAYGYFGARDLDPVVYGKWTDEMRFLTPWAREQVEARLEEREPVEQFERIYRVKHWTTAAFVDAGGGHLLTVGTDHPSWGEYLSGFSIHREMHALSLRAALPNHVVLRAATVNGARALGLDDVLGTVERGKYADLVVVRGDPLTDITATRDVETVIKAGEVHDPEELLRSVEGRMGPSGPPSEPGGDGGP